MFSPHLLPETFDFASIDPYELTMLVIGVTLLLGVMIPQLLLRRYYTFPLIFMGMGALLFGLNPELSRPIPFTGNERHFWERLTEAVLVISLVGAGLKIDQHDFWKWRISLRLLAITMPICIILTAWLGMVSLAFSLPAAVLLGAMLAPTDPVLAGDIQVGPPNQGDGNRVRFALTSEAGLNDGASFPFVYLAIGLASLGTAHMGDWIGTWFVRDLIYRLVMGVFMGWLVGKTLAFLLYRFPKNNPIAESSMGVMALCLFFVVYGATELVGGYGFVAAFIGAVMVRRSSFEHSYNHTMFEFTENLEHGLTAVTLFFLGGLWINVWKWITMPILVVVTLLILVVRPLAGWIGLIGSNYTYPERAVVSFYGIRGLGSVYYLAYATSAASFTEAPQMWAIVLTALIMSSVIHGITAIPVMRYIDLFSRIHRLKA